MSLKSEEAMSSTATDHSSVGRSLFGQDNKRGTKLLTVSEKSKVQKGQEIKKDVRPHPSRHDVFFKWLASILIGLLFLACLVLSKFSIIALSNTLNINTTGNADLNCSGEQLFQTDVDSARGFLMIILLLLIPNVINFIRGIWLAIYRNDLHWPGKKALLISLLIGIFESFGLCIIVLKVFRMSTSAALSVLISNCVCIVPVIYYLWLCFKSMWIREYRKDTTSILIFSMLALLMLLAGFVLIIILVKEELHPSYKYAAEIWYLPVAILFISFSWIPGIQKKMLESNDNSAPSSISSNTTGYVSGSLGEDNTACFTSQSEVENESHVQLETSASRATYRETNKTWKLTIWLSFVKTFSIIMIGITIFNVKYKHSTESSLNLFKQAWNWESTKTDVYFFLINAASSLVGYLLAFLACTTCMQKIAFAVPLFLATPLTFSLLYVSSICKSILDTTESDVICSTLKLELLIPAIILLTLAQMCSVGWVVYRSETIVMQKEDMLFWIPTYNGVLLEQWLLQARRNKHPDVYQEEPLEKVKRTKVYICTTMYRENEAEMRQLLESINHINYAQSKEQRQFESHIFFDGGVNKDSSPTDFALQLIALFSTTLGVDIDKCSKTRTPYGVSLAWKLNADLEHSGMTVRVHLKDNVKVKNKKRWSQVMYMSYILDFLMEQSEGQADETFILCTDADVYFNANNVEALLDLMTRDPSVGAVCARTHPQGNSPLVWYQKFEYAIGHWFQKAAEHVLGSVLCAPGCFSVYRCSAIRDVLPTYATNVESPLDFLTKDMGEDRWLCTLLVQSGWRIEYCAASENTTHCPEDFDEFYKQRRRWIASTIANLMIFFKEWRLIRKFNQRLSVFFLIYQAILLLSTIIGPATVILIVAGGLDYGWNISPVATIILQCLICIGFSIFCLYTSQDTQLKVAKFLTILYSLVMAGVAVGMAFQVAKSFHKEEGPGEELKHNTSTVVPTTITAISDDFPLSTTTMYLGIVIILFAVTGLLHLKECFYLLHGIWYLLCLPSGYLLLTIYSICNITDRSWGTREEKDMTVVRNKKWNESLEHFLKSIFFCCKMDTRDVAKQTEADESIAEESDTTGRNANEGASISSRAEVVVGDNIAVKVEEWLPAEIRDMYLHLFQRNGFDTTMFISGMTEKELINIGVKRKGHLKFLLEQIRNLPDFDIEAYVPKRVDVWLDQIGLGEYKAAFKSNLIEGESHMEILKYFSRKDIEKELGISKAGHIKRLMYAIGKLRHPTEGERQRLEVKQKLSVITEHDLKEVNIQEYDFWDRLRKVSLLPGIKTFGLEEDLKEKLRSFRNFMLMVLLVSNTLWIILLAILASQTRLTVVASNPIGLAFLVIYSIIFVIQFLCMLVHRVITLSHFLARTPYRCGDGYNSSWSFDDTNIMMRIAQDDGEGYARVREFVFELVSKPGGNTAM